MQIGREGEGINLVVLREAEIDRLVRHLPWLDIKALLKCAIIGLVQRISLGRKGMKLSHGSFGQVMKKHFPKELLI